MEKLNQEMVGTNSLMREFFLLDAFIVPAGSLMRGSFSLPQRKVALFGEVKSPDH